MLGFLLKEGCAFTIYSPNITQPQDIPIYFSHLIQPFATVLGTPVSSYPSEMGASVANWHPSDIFKIHTLFLYKMLDGKSKHQAMFKIQILKSK